MRKEAQKTVRLTCARPWVFETGTKRFQIRGKTLDLRKRGWASNPSASGLSPEDQRWLLGWGMGQKPQVPVPPSSLQHVFAVWLSQPLPLTLVQMYY